MRRVSKLAAGFAAAALMLAGCASDDEPSTEPTEGGGDDAVRVGLAFDVGGQGDLGFNDAAYAGLTRATEELGVEHEELSPNADGSNRADLLRQLADGGFNPIIGVGYAFGEDIDTVAAEYPDLQFIRIDGGPSELENVAVNTFADEQASFLMGAAAALKTQTQQIGFIGGNEGAVINAFGSGFKAGVAAVAPSIVVEDQRLSPGEDPAGFNDVAGARVAAEAMYDRGVDVIYTPAGGSNQGTFEAAAAREGKWAIGTDLDQYETVGDPNLQQVILSSMLKRVDNAVFNSIQTFIDEGSVESTNNDLAVDGVGYSTSGGFIDDIVDQLEDFKQQIIDGEITVERTE